MIALLVVAGVAVVIGSLLLGTIAPCNVNNLPMFVPSVEEAILTNTIGHVTARTVSDLTQTEAQCRRGEIYRRIGLVLVVSGSLLIISIKTSCMCF
jgi:hypothetical protein